MRNVWVGVGLALAILAASAFTVWVDAFFMVPLLAVNATLLVVTALAVAKNMQLYRANA